MYRLRFAKTFDPSYQSIVKGDKKLEKRTEKALMLLETDPTYPSLKSHKVETKSFGKRWSSWITSDLRIIWDFDEVEQLVILLLVIAKHSGSHKQYK